MSNLDKKGDGLKALKIKDWGKYGKFGYNGGFLSRHGFIYIVSLFNNQKSAKSDEMDGFY